jgi:hypothetical protein
VQRSHAHGEVLPALRIDPLKNTDILIRNAVTDG